MLTGCVEPNELLDRRWNERGILPKALLQAAILSQMPSDRAQDDGRCHRANNQRLPQCTDEVHLVQRLPIRSDFQQERARGILLGVERISAPHRHEISRHLVHNTAELGRSLGVHVPPGSHPTRRRIREDRRHRFRQVEPLRLDPADVLGRKVTADVPSASSEQRSELFFGMGLQPRLEVLQPGRLERSVESRAERRVVRGIEVERRTTKSPRIA